jgi:hypothetical protein
VESARIIAAEFMARSAPSGVQKLPVFREYFRRPAFEVSVDRVDHFVSSAVFAIALDFYFNEDAFASLKQALLSDHSEYLEVWG